MIIVPKPQKILYLEDSFNIKNGLIASKRNLEKIKKDADFFKINIAEGNKETENFFLYEDITFKEEEYEIIIDTYGIKVLSSSDKISLNTPKEMPWSYISI